MQLNNGNVFIHKKTFGNNSQKKLQFIVKFVNTYGALYDIIINVKTPNTLYIFCYTP